MPLIPLDDPEVEPRTPWERWVGWAVVLACCAFVAHRIHLVTFDDGRIGSLVLRNTTTNGGDMGAHVYWPWFLANEWFPNFRLQGWSPHWYSGFPIGQFYFPLPAVAIALLDLVLPYNVAFKLVVVSGPIALPAAAYAFGAKLRFPWPAPPLFAVVAVRYLFEVRNGLNNASNERGWTIYGGNLASTMAGEFSFTIALALALFFLAALARYLETGRRGWLPALLLAGCVTSHIVVAAFAAVMALLVVALYGGRWISTDRIRGRDVWRKLWRSTLPVAIVAFLLTATWSIPLVGAQHMTASMRYEKVRNWGSFLFGLKSVNGTDGWTSSGSVPKPLWLWLLVAIAVFLCGWWRRPTTFIVLVATTFFGVLFVVWPEHHIWNTRFAPFYWLLLGFTAAIGVAELARFIAYAWVGGSDWIREGDRLDHLAALERRAAESRLASSEEHWAPPPSIESIPEYLLDDHPTVVRRRAITVSVVIGVIGLVAGGWSFVWTTDNQSVGSGWSRYNFEGYEAKPGWLEYKALMDAMGELEPGRALWETGNDPNSDNGAFGNYGGDLSLELLPYWTDGRIGSMEGLYFESSATMPYHFLTISHVSADPSQPVRGLRYANNYPHDKSFDLGVRQMRALGVRYFMAFTDSAIANADSHPDLTLVKTLGDLDGAIPTQWKIYEIGDWGLVAPLAYEPAVIEPKGGTTADCFGPNPNFPTEKQFSLDDWECTAAPWWMQPELLDRPFAESGPEGWQRYEDVGALRDGAPRALAPVEITDVVEEVDSLSFHVDEIGVPVVVRSSFFPNWEVSGAEGPYRLAPNMMVVIPTEHDVKLTYGLTSWDWLGRILTLAGVVGLVWLFRRRPDRAAWFSPTPIPAPSPSELFESVAYDAPTPEPAAPDETAASPFPTTWRPEVLDPGDPTDPR